MHNVRLDRIEETKGRAASDPQATMLQVNMAGAWQADDGDPQFAGTVTFAQGDARLEADFPPFLGGDGRTPSPLTYCFFGAMACYGATFAMQAAMAGVEIRDLRVTLALSVDFHTALGLGEHVPLSRFDFEVQVDTDASDEEIQRVKQLADERCPAIWAMENPVPYRTRAQKV
ncbi:MAG TPA: OsmC family protein [Actinomycetota bacterium]|nr:OsmC family protein [Actinomycetota bacterium]